MGTSQQGMYPASNLYAGATHINITVQTLVGGVPVGPNTCITVGKDYTRFLGFGRLQNFTSGIDLNGFIGSNIDMWFNNTSRPIINTGVTPNEEYDSSRSFGIARERIRRVGVGGDHLDLWEAVAAANIGDKILVLQNQSLSTNQVINKDIDIEFLNDSRINVLNAMSGNVLTLGTKVKTKKLKMIASLAGSYDTLILFSGSRGYHEDISIETSSASSVIINAYKLDIGAKAVYAHGALVRGSASISNPMLNSSGYPNHDILIRDTNTNTIYTDTPYFSTQIISATDNYSNAISKLDQNLSFALSDTAVEEDVLTFLGQTTVSFSTLSFDPSNASYDAKFYRNGVKVKQDPGGGLTQDLRKISSTDVEFAYGLRANDRVTCRLEKLASISILPPQSYFLDYVDGVSGSTIAIPDSYNIGTDKLNVYRNGLYLAKSPTIGAPIDRYGEVTSSSVVVGVPAAGTDLFTFVNYDSVPTARVFQDGLGGTVLTVPSYVVSSNRLKVYRNGLIMNAAGLGSLADQYSETSPTTITLGLTAAPSDVFAFHIAGASPTFRQDSTGLTGTVLTVPLYTIGDKKLFVWKNGILMVNSLSLGGPGDRYTETSTTSITLVVAAVATDVFTFIYK
jgi:hypothetical protein